jgi:hypothetical protein
VRQGWDPFLFPSCTVISHFSLEVGARSSWRVFSAWEPWMYEYVPSLYTIARSIRRNIGNTYTNNILFFRENSPIISHFPPTKCECLEYLQRTGCLSFASSSFSQLRQHSFNCWCPFLMCVEFVYCSNSQDFYTVGTGFYLFLVCYIRVSWLPRTVRDFSCGPNMFVHLTYRDNKCATVRFFLRELQHMTGVFRDWPYSVLR